MIKNKIIKKTLMISIICIFLLTSITAISVSSIKINNISTKSDQWEIIFVDDDWEKEDDVDRAKLQNDFNLDYVLMWHRDLWENIQDAIDSDACDDGDRVYVFPGNYGNVEIDKSITLEGDDKAITIIKGKQKLPGDYSHHDSVEVYAPNVKVTGFTLDFDGEDESGIGSSISLKNGADGAIIEENIITSTLAYEFGLQIKAQCENVKIKNNEFLETNYAIISFKNLQNLEITGNSIHDCGAGVHIKGTLVNPQINNNIITDNDWAGLYCAAIETNNYKDCEFLNNQIKNNGEQGIYLVNINPYSGNIPLIKGNTVSDNGYYDDKKHSGLILLRGEADVIDNTIKDNSGNGISLSGSSNCLIEDNTIQGNGKVGVYVSYVYENSAKQNTINKNLIKGNKLGIEIKSSNYNIITSNTIEKNIERGLVIDSSKHNQIYYNNFIENYGGIIGGNAKLKSYNSYDNIWHDGESQGNYWSDYEAWCLEELEHKAKYDMDSDPNPDYAKTWKDPYEVDTWSSYSDGDKSDCYPWIQPDGVSKDTRAKAKTSPVFKGMIVKLLDQILNLEILFERFPLLK